MSKPAKPAPLVSLAEFARKANVTFARAKTLVDTGKIVPDFESHGQRLFIPSRVTELSQLIQL